MIRKQIGLIYFFPAICGCVTASFMINRFMEASSATRIFEITLVAIGLSLIVFLIQLIIFFFLQKKLVVSTSGMIYESRWQDWNIRYRLMGYAKNTAVVLLSGMYPCTFEKDGYMDCWAGMELVKLQLLEARLNLPAFILIWLHRKFSRFSKDLGKKWMKIKYVIHLGILDSVTRESVESHLRASHWIYRYNLYTLFRRGA